MDIDKKIIQQNHYIGFRFHDGYYFMRILGMGTSNLRYNIKYDSSTSYHAALQTTADWDLVPVSTSDSRRRLEPQEADRDKLFYQIFYGISPSMTQIYLQQIPRQDRHSLVPETRTVPGDIGYFTGEISPFNNPSPMTEIFTFNDIYPGLKAYNPTSVTVYAYLKFYINKYIYEAVKDEKIIKEFIEGKRRCDLRTMGELKSMIVAPSWLANQYKGVPKTAEALGIKVV